MKAPLPETDTDWVEGLVKVFVTSPEGEEMVLAHRYKFGRLGGPGMLPRMWWAILLPVPWPWAGCATRLAWGMVC